MELRRVVTGRQQPSSFYDEIFQNDLSKINLWVHKSYIINIDKVERFNSKFEIGAMKIPLSRNKEDLIKHLLYRRLLLIKSTLTETLIALYWALHQTIQHFLNSFLPYHWSTFGILIIIILIYSFLILLSGSSGPRTACSDLAHHLIQPSHLPLICWNLAVLM
jgi:hypothetical protein